MARVDLSAELKTEVLDRLARNESLDTIHAALQEKGWPGSRATLGNRIVELRARPEQELQRQIAEARARPIEAPAPAAPSVKDAPAAPPAERDALTELREAQALMRSLSRRAVQEVQKGGGSIALALKAVDTFASLTMKIRRLEKQEKPQEKGYRVVEVRLPAKDAL